MRLCLLAGVAVLALAGTAAAGTTTTLEKVLAACNGSLAAADTNGDGWVSRQEAKAFFDANFALLDGNADGKVTRAEFAACHAGTGQVTTTRTTVTLMSDDPFFRIDRNKDHRLEEAEWLSYGEARFEALHRDGTVVTVGAYMTAMKGVPGITPAIDRNGDGVVDLDEVVRELLASFQTLDTNGDGIITAFEYAAGKQQKTAASEQTENAPTATKAQLDAAFARIDTNGDGVITLDEYRAAGLARFTAAAEKAGSDPDVAVPVSALSGQ